MSTGLTPDTVIDLLQLGNSQAEIARDFGVSRQYVNKLAKQGGYESPFKTMNDNLPWEIKGEFANNQIWKNIRRHGIWVTTGKLGESDREHLRGFYRKLDAFPVVADHDPDYPPLPGIANQPGFAFVPRTEADEDFIVKVRPGTSITKIGDRIWRMPAIRP